MLSTAPDKERAISAIFSRCLQADWYDLCVIAKSQVH